MTLPILPEELGNLPKLREFLKALLDALTGTIAGAATIDYVDAADAAIDSTISTLDAQNIKKNGSVAFTGNESMGGHHLTNVADPTLAQDAATKAYVDIAAAGNLQIKSVVKEDGIGALDPVDGTTITFTVLASSPSSSAACFIAASGYVSGNNSLPSDVLSVVVDRGLPGQKIYTLSAFALQIGAGADRAFNAGLSGSFAPILDSGVHTIDLKISQSGLGFNASPGNPLTLSVIYPA